MSQFRFNPIGGPVTRWYHRPMPDLSPTNPARPTDPNESDRTARYEGAATPSDPPATDDIQPATLIAGKYKLLEAIGEGGMGEVWMAQQIEPVKRGVAVKFVKSGMDSKTVVARFEAERQALSMMDHPNIARVFDVGTTSNGRPFLVMELVKGTPITEFCDQRKLTPRQRLELFVPVCLAIQHAHQKGIIHRDIKPSNVLVALHDDKPMPKVIDFGVAKAIGTPLTEKTLHTAFEQVVGTPAYMSPEQATFNQLDIDTRSDVYSLGVLLYELLTGTTPIERERFRQAALMEMLRLVREEEPPRPSTRLSSTETKASIAAQRGTEPMRLSKELRAELDWVVMKSLEKDRTRRYDSPGHFAADVQRYLTGETVMAHPPSAHYRMRKFVRRHRGPVVAGTMVLLALLAGIAGTSIGLARAERARIDEADQRRIAEDQERDARRSAEEERQAKLREAAQRTRADEKAEEARHALYAARQQVAMNAWRENRADLLAEVVERQKPAAGESDLRGFEWAYLDRLSRSPGRRWQTTGKMVNGVALTSDDRTAVTVGFDGKATAWDVATGQKKWDTGGQLRWSVNAVAVAPDNRTVALAGHLGQLQLWSIDGTFQAHLKGHEAQVFGVSFSPDGKVLASASADLSIRLWSGIDGKPLGVLSAPPPVQGLTRPVSNPAESTGHTDMIWQAKWSPDGGRLATCSSDGSIKVWSFPEKRLLRTMVGHEGIVISVAWSPDGRSLVGVSRPLVGNSGGEVKLWNPETGRAEATFRPPTGGMHSVAFTHDGLFIVTAGADRTVRVWRRDGRLAAEHRGFRDEVIGMAVGGGGRWAVAGTRGGEIVALQLDTTRGRHSTSTPDNTLLAATADGRLAAFHDGAVHWHDPDTLAESAVWPAVKMEPPKQSERVFSGSMAFALRSDGQAAHSAHPYRGPGTVVWREAGGRVRHLLAGHEAPITEVAFLPGDRLASADESGTLLIWNGATGKDPEKIRLWDGPVQFLIASADGRLWAAGTPRTTERKLGEPAQNAASEGRLARIEDGRIADTIKTPSPIFAGDYSPDERTLVVVRQDGVLQWLDARDGREIRSRTPATGAAGVVAFSPTERRIAVGGGAGSSVRLLDSDSGEELLALDGLPRGASSIAFTPDGRRLVAAVGAPLLGGKLIVWDGRPGRDSTVLAAPDVTWHKARLAAATGQDEVRFGPSNIDSFAARFHLTRLAALEPDAIQWPRQLLGMDQDAKDFKSAVARLDGILRRWPDDAPMWYDLGNAKRELDDAAGAEAAYRKCIALDPDMAMAHCNLGLLLGREGRFEESIDCLKRGHELGMAMKTAGKNWPYPSAAWLARNRRLAEVAKTYAGWKPPAMVSEEDRIDFLEVLTVTKRPLAAVHLADAKATSSPGPVVIGAAMRCGEGIGDASGLNASERSAWRNKALAWLKLDWDQIRSTGPARLVQQATGMRGHPLLLLSRSERTAAWPDAEREAWRKFWAEVEEAIPSSPLAPRREVYQYMITPKGK